MSPTVPPTSTMATSASPAPVEDPALDFVGDVRDHLHGAAEVVAAALLADHALVDLAGGEVVALAHPHVDEALVVAEVEVGLGAVLGDEHLAVLERLIVPGSTLMYGSSLRLVTRMPREARIAASDAAAMPFPSEETTPPVTKTNLVMGDKSRKFAFYPMTPRLAND